MHPDDMCKVKIILEKTLIDHLIAINSSKLSREDRCVILDFPLGLLLEKDSGYIVAGIESIINEELKAYGLTLKRYSVYALASGDFYTADPLNRLRDITAMLVEGGDPNKKDIVTVRNAIEALISGGITNLSSVA